MNDKSLECLKAYDMQVKKMIKGRGVTVQALQPAKNHQQAQRNAEHIGNRLRGKQQQQAKQNVQHTEVKLQP